MYFSSMNELFNMAGHGKYVWGCVAFSTFLILLVFVIALRNFKKQYQLNQQLGKLPE